MEVMFSKPSENWELAFLSFVVFGEFFTELTEQGYEFADELFILVREKGNLTLSNRLQSALNHAMKWCKTQNPKTQI
jgi:hypothetical protein